MDFEHLSLLKELVAEVAGKNTEIVVDILKSEKPINEFKIADKLKLTINQARNILYKLYNQGIVAFVRKKDEKKGWYIYSWSLNVPKALERMKGMKEKSLHEMEHLLNSRENKRYYKCPNGCVELNEESAMLHDFVCAECGSVLVLDSTEVLEKETKDKIHGIKVDISKIENEIRKIDGERIAKIEKERERVAKAKKRKRAAVRNAKKRSKARLIRKLNRKKNLRRKQRGKSAKKRITRKRGKK